MAHHGDKYLNARAASAMEAWLAGASLDKYGRPKKQTIGAIKVHRAFGKASAHHGG